MLTTHHHLVKVKVKWSCYRPGVAHRVGRGTALLFHDRGTRRGWVVSSTPQPHYTPGKTRYPFYRRLGGPQGRSGRVENLVPTGIRSQTVQPVAQSLYRLRFSAHHHHHHHLVRRLKEERAILLFHFWAFMAGNRVNFTFLSIFTKFHHDCTLSQVNYVSLHAVQFVFHNLALTYFIHSA